MGSESEARKWHCSYSQDRSQSWNKRQRSNSRDGFEPRRSYEEIRSIYDRFKTPEMREQPDRHDRLRTPLKPSISSRCTVCKCETCTQNQKTLKQNQKTLDDIKSMISKKMDVKIVGSESAKADNLCERTPAAEDMVINYTYIDLGI